MHIDKVSKSYNDYKVELSWGQLEVIAAALERDHADPVADEIYAELQWYMDRLPGPGEEEEDVKAREAHEDELAAGGEDEGPLPMPPRDEAAEQEPEGDTPFERLTGRPEPAQEEPPLPPETAGEPEEPPGFEDMGEPAPAPPPKATMMPGSPASMSTPPATIESQRKSSKKPITEKVSVGSKYRDAKKILAKGGLKENADYWIDKGLHVKPDMADAVVTLLRESERFSKVKYLPSKGRVRVELKEEVEALAAPPEN